MTLTKLGIDDTRIEQINENTDNVLSLYEALAETRFDLGLSKLNYEDGTFDTFIDDTKVTLGSPTPSTSLDDEGYDNLTPNVPEPITSYGTNGSLRLGIRRTPNYANDTNITVSGPWGIAVKPDGTKAYITERDLDNVIECSMSTAYDIGTLSEDATHDISSYVGSPETIQMSDDGNTMFVKQFNNELYEFSLSSWSGAPSYQTNFTLNSGYGISVSGNGSYLYHIYDKNNDQHIGKFNLSTAWDLSTASLVQEVNVESEIGNLFGLISVDPNGEYFYYEDNSVIDQYFMSTPHDLTTISYQDTFDITTEVSNVQYTAPPEFANGGEKVYIPDTDNNKILGFNHPTGYQIIYPEYSAPSVFTEYATLGFTPTSVVVSDERVFTNDMSIEYIIEDSADNSVHVTDSEVGSEVDVSALTDGDLQITVVMDSASPTVDDALDAVGFYFN